MDNNKRGLNLDAVMVTTSGNSKPVVKQTASGDVQLNFWGKVTTHHDCIIKDTKSILPLGQVL